MADYKTFYYDENFGGGDTPRWTTTRLKASMQGTCVVTDVGQAGDYGTDPSAADILAAGITADPNFARWPTHRAWSSGVEAMLFWVDITGNTAGDLTVDLEFYEGVYGTTGLIEEYRLIRAHGEQGNNSVVGIETDGGQVFVRIGGITNPDGSATMHVRCRRASYAFLTAFGGGGSAGGGLFLDEELSPVGGYLWSGTGWVRAAGSATGATTVVQPVAALLNCTEASAVANLAANTATMLSAAGIDTNTTHMADGVEEHDAAPTDTAGYKVLIEALDNPAGAAVADTDLVRIRGSVNGGAMICGYNGVGAQTIDFPIEVFGTAASNNSIPVSCRASDVIQLAVAVDDVAPSWGTLNGARVVGGYDVTSNLSRNLPIEVRGVVSSDTGLPVGGVVDTTIPAANGDGDFVPLWMGPQGTVGIHGYDATNNQPRALPVESGTAVVSGIGVPTLFRVDTTVPGASGDNTVVQPFATPEGALVVGGVDVANTISHNLPVETTDSDHSDKGVPVGAEAISGTPAALDDGDYGTIATNLTRSQLVHLTQALTRASQVTTFEEPPSGGAPGTTNISNAASTAISASIECIEVTAQNNGTGWMRVGIGTQTATTGIVLQPGDTRTMQCTNVSLVEGWAQNLNDPCGYDYKTRA